MKKRIVLSLLVAGLVTGLQAGGDIGGVVSIENEVAPVEVTVPVKEVEAPKKVVVEAPKKVVEKKSPSKFYMVAKGVYITGEDADSGMGGGLDLGYNLTDSLAVELGGTVTKNDLDNGDEGTYNTGSLSLVYTYHATDKVGLFAKAGYTMEQVKYDDADYDETESGAVFGAGLEYGMSESTALVAEYEMSTIDKDDSSRGDAVSLGLKYNF